MRTIAKFDSVPAMKKALKESGNHFFSKGAMEFFNSKVETPLLSGSFFVTSEYMDDPADRMYSARYFTVEDGRYDSHEIGEFREYGTVAEARAAIFQFQQRAVMKRRVESALAEVGLTPGVDENDGAATLAINEHDFQHADIFGGESLDESGVRLYGVPDPRDSEVVKVGGFQTPQKFAQFVRARVDAFIADYLED